MICLKINHTFWARARTHTLTHQIIGWCFSSFIPSLSLSIHIFLSVYLIFIHSLWSISIYATASFHKTNLKLKLVFFFERWMNSLSFSLSHACTNSLCSNRHKTVQQHKFIALHEVEIPVHQTISAIFDLFHGHEHDFPCECIDIMNWLPSKPLELAHSLFFL